MPPAEPSILAGSHGARAVSSNPVACIPSGGALTQSRAVSKAQKCQPVRARNGVVAPYICAVALRSASRPGDRSLRGAIVHADHGAQDYATLCDQLGVTLSLGGVGTSADNALAEPFNATFKREALAGAAAFTDEQSCHR